MTEINGLRKQPATTPHPTGALLSDHGKAHLLPRVWCNDCRRIADLDPGEQAERHGADLDLLVWRSRPICSECGSRKVDSIITPGSTGGLGDR